MRIGRSSLYFLGRLKGWIDGFCSKSRRVRGGCGKGGIIPESPGLPSFSPPGGAGFDTVSPHFRMSLTSTDIARIATLARLQLAPDESTRLQGQINGFFDLVEKMRAVDTTGLEPLAHPVAAIEDITLRLRDDVVSEPNNREANQKSAPAIERGLFLVPKVIE